MEHLKNGVKPSWNLRNSKGKVLRRIGKSTLDEAYSQAKICVYLFEQTHIGDGWEMTVSHKYYIDNDTDERRCYVG